MAARIRLRFLLPALILACGGRAATAQDSMRCAGGLVSVGDSKLDLLGKCLTFADGKLVRIETGSYGYAR